MPKTKQAVEKDPSASLRSTASLQLAYSVWLMAYGSLVPSICHKLSAICQLTVCRAPRIWDLFDQPVNRADPESAQDFLLCASFP